MKLLFYGTFYILVFLCSTFVKAQDIESIGKRSPVKVSGSLALNNTFYKAVGISYRRPPYVWYIMGNLNVDIYGWSVPISVSYSNQNVQFRQPFNHYGMSPRYKWITTHFGYRNMTFSPYTLGGITFLGAGVELTPGIFRFSAMYGRLYKAIEEDTNSTVNVVPAYRRRGGGFKVGVGKNGDFIDFCLFAAKDDISSLPYVPVSADVLPASNMVYSLNGQKKFAKKIVVAAEYASSAYSRDLQAAEYDRPVSVFTPFIINRQSTEYHKAFKATIAYNAKLYGITFGYERIDPNFKTMGSYFFNNDIINYTVMPTIRFFKQKLSVNANIGIQKNNIQKQDVSSVNRTLMAFNVNYMPSQKWNFAAQYSNFTMYNRISTKFTQLTTLDSLNFYQVTESANFNTAYNTGTKERKHGVNLNVSFQRANQTQGENVTHNSSRFYNGNLSYRVNIVPSSITFSLGCNANKNEVGGLPVAAFGPSTSFGKLFFEKKLRTNITLTYNTTYKEKKSSGDAWNMSATAGYTYKKHHNLNLNLLFLNRVSTGLNAVNFTEYTLLVGYGYSF